MQTSEELILASIQVAKANRDKFGCSILKRDLHICLRVANEIMDELVKRGIIEISYRPEYRVSVRI